MIVCDCATQYHFIMITHRTLPAENKIVNKVDMITRIDK
jgi:hypothetical protein